MKDLRKLMGDDEYEARMKAARARAEWELGDSSWAGVIVRAFLDPVDDDEMLARELGEDP